MCNDIVDIAYFSSKLSLLFTGPSPSPLHKAYLSKAIWTTWSCPLLLTGLASQWDGKIRWFISFQVCSFTLQRERNILNLSVCFLWEKSENVGIIRNWFESCSLDCQCCLLTGVLAQTRTIFYVVTFLQLCYLQFALYRH